MPYATAGQRSPKMDAEQPPLSPYQRAGLLLLALLAPTLVGYALYNQWRTPVVDFNFDTRTGEILTVEQNSYGNYAGFMPGDVWLSVNGAAFDSWHTLPPGLYPADIHRDGERLTLELPIVPLAKVNWPALGSATLTTLLYWGIGLLLFLRRSQYRDVRLLYLLSQVFAILILFPLAYPYGIPTPRWTLDLSSTALFIAAPLLVHLYLIFPVSLGKPAYRHWGLTVLYGMATLSLLGWLAGPPPVTGIAASYVIIEILVALGVLLYSYIQRANYAERRRVRLILFGNFIAASPALLGYVLPQHFGWTYQLPEWSVALCLVIAPLSYLYAAIRQQLFDIDRFLNRALVYALLSLSIFLVYLGPFILLYRLVPGDVLAQTLVGTWLTLLLGLAFNWGRERIQQQVDRLFYGGWYDYPQVVETASNALARTLERTQLSDVLTRQVPALMQLEPGELRLGEAMALPSITGDRQNAFPLRFGENVQGYWFVGPRRDGDEHSMTDRRILETVAHQAEIALGNVLLVETLRRQIEEIHAHQETLARTQRQLLRSREEERARLARDLHDGPLQTLVGLRLQMELLRSQQAGAGFPNPSLQEMSAEVKALLGELRRVCAALRPPLLDTLGLSAALTTLVEEWVEQQGIPAQVQTAPEPLNAPLPDEVAVNLYRVAQEGLANIAHHAHAEHVILRLERTPQALRLTLTDDGVGFNVPENLSPLAATEHYGLLGIRERVELIGGQLRLHSAPGAGTSITVTWQPT